MASSPTPSPTKEVHAVISTAKRVQPLDRDQRSYSGTRGSTGHQRQGYGCCHLALSAWIEKSARGRQENHLDAWVPILPEGSGLLDTTRRPSHAMVRPAPRRPTVSLVRRCVAGRARSASDRCRISALRCRVGRPFPMHNAASASPVVRRLGEALDKRLMAVTTTNFRATYAAARPASGHPLLGCPDSHARLTRHCLGGH